jgi:vitamin B12 transporter
MNTSPKRSGGAPFAIAASLALSAPALAQDREPDEDKVIRNSSVAKTDILVSADRADAFTFLENYTGSATVIADYQIENRQIRNVEDVLRDVPGVAVAVTPGQTQIRLRGSEANHVLVLVDGIEVSDPGSGEFDIGTLQAEIGSRVEVLRGPQSALYGNDALAGVVAYSTASGGEREGFSSFVEGGTNNTINVAARYGASGKGWDAALSAIVVSTDGEPNARAIAGNGVRDIGRDSYTLSGKGSVEVAPDLSLRAVGRYVLTEGQFNRQDFTFGSPTNGLVVDSPGVGFETESLSGLVGASLAASGGDWTHDLSLQFTAANRQDFAPAGLVNDNESDRIKASYITAYDFGGTGHSLTFAADYELEGFNNVTNFDDRKEAENVGFVGEYRYAGERFDFAAALRHDVNDLFKDATTYRIGAGFRVTDTTRLRASVGTGVKNPTLSELFGFFDGVFLGNPGLQPEQSTSWEVGIDQSFAEGRVTLSATFFSAELENEIFTSFPPPDFIATPGNRMTRSTRQGVELALAARLGGGFGFNGAYTFLDAEEDGAEEIRRPDHIASAVLDWSDPQGRGSVNLAVRYNGEARDNNFATFPATVETLEVYTLVSLNGRVTLSEGLNLFARAENLLGEDYEQVFSFVAPGTQVIAGFEARF